MYLVIISSIICLDTLLYHHLLKQCLLYHAIQGYQSEHRTTDANRGGSSPNPLHATLQVEHKRKISHFPNKVLKSNTEAIIQQEAHLSFKLDIKDPYALPDRNKFPTIFQIVLQHAHTRMNTTPFQHLITTPRMGRCWKISIALSCKLGIQEKLTGCILTAAGKL